MKAAAPFSMRVELSSWNFFKVSRNDYWTSNMSHFFGFRSQMELLSSREMNFSINLKILVECFCGRPAHRIPYLSWSVQNPTWSPFRLWKSDFSREFKAQRQVASHEKSERKRIRFGNNSSLVRKMKLVTQLKSVFFMVFSVSVLPYKTRPKLNRTINWGLLTPRGLPSSRRVRCTHISRWRCR